MTFKTWTLAVASVVIAGAASVAPSPAHAETALEKLLRLVIHKDEESKGPPPEKSLQAPFSSSTTVQTQSAGGSLAGMYDAKDAASLDKSSTNLDVPHRSPEQVADWSSGIVSQAMTIAPQTWQTDFGKISGNFAPYAAEEYKAFLSSSNMLSLLTNQKMKLLSVTDGPGIVLKEGAINGTYHWLIQIPLMSSYYSVDTQEIDKTTTVQSQHLLVQVQVGRIATKKADDIGLIIERWHVSQSAPQSQ